MVGMVTGHPRALGRLLLFACLLMLRSFLPVRAVPPGLAGLCAGHATDADDARRWPWLHVVPTPTNVQRTKGGRVLRVWVGRTVFGVGEPSMANPA